MTIAAPLVVWVAAGPAAPVSAATLVVTTTATSGEGSLRSAIIAARSTPSDDTIVFADSVRGEIDLTSIPDIAIDGQGGSLTITGPGADLLTVRSLELNAEAGAGRLGGFIDEVEVSGLTIIGGQYAVRAVGVGEVTLTELVIRDTTRCGALVGEVDREAVFTATVSKVTVTGELPCGLEFNVVRDVQIRDVSLDSLGLGTGIRLHRARDVFICDARFEGFDVGLGVNRLVEDRVHVARSEFTANVTAVGIEGGKIGAGRTPDKVEVLDSLLEGNSTALDASFASAELLRSRLVDNGQVVVVDAVSNVSISESAIDGSDVVITADRPSTDFTFDSVGIYSTSVTRANVFVEATGYPVFVRNSVITESGDDTGPLLQLSGGSLLFVSSTLSGNSHTGSPLLRGDDVDISAWSSVIVADGVEPIADLDAGSPFAADGSFLSDDASLTADGESRGPNVVGADPQLVATPVGDRTGLEPTSGSPVIDIGVASPDFDQPVDMRLVDRLIGSATDAGAIEFDPTAAATTPIVPVDPVRVLDTRLPTTHEVDCAVSAGRDVRVPVAGLAGVPGDAAAAVVNLTAIRPIDTGFATLYGCDGERLDTSSINFAAGTNVANEVIVDLDGLALCLFSSVQAEYAVDLVGYVPAGSDLVVAGGRRLLDTRPGATTADGGMAGGGRLAAGSVLELDVAGRADVPDGVDTVVAYVSAVQPDGVGFVTAWPCDQPQPTTSVLNVVAGVNRGNEVVAALGASGDLCIFVSESMHLTVDVAGWASAATGLVSVVPERLLDTRTSGSPVTNVSLDVTQSDAVPDDAVAVIANLTAVRPGDVGFVTATACGVTPDTSSLNYTPGVNGGNAGVAPSADDGTVCLDASSPVHLTVDLSAVVGDVT